MTLEHLFYGMIHLNAGILSEILFLLKLDQQFKNLLKKTLYFFKIQLNDSDEKPEYDEHFHLVLKVAASISEKLGHEYVGVEHISFSFT